MDGPGKWPQDGAKKARYVSRVSINHPDAAEDFILGNAKKSCLGKKK